VTEPATSGAILIVGIGNTLRRDDGAGWLFAERLADELCKVEERVCLEKVHQLTPELAIEVVDLGATAIVFVDASIAVQSTTLTPLTDDNPSTSITHSLTPAALLLMVRRLYAVESAGWLVQVPAEDFDHGEGLSELAQRGLTAAPAIATALHANLCITLHSTPPAKESFSNA
jgi:hydrogenase maturation protease